MQKVVIIGAGGHARELLDIFAAASEANARFEVHGYIVESPYGTPGMLVRNRPILGDFDWLEGREDEVVAICGVGACELRRRLTQRALEMGVDFCSVVHPSAVVSSRAVLGQGVVIAPGAIVTTQEPIGDHVHINMGSTVAHDVILNDFVTISPGVNLSGNVVVEEGAYVGTGASVIEERRIGCWSVIGAGAVVINDIPSNTTAVGNPARVVSTRPAGWHLETGATA